MTNSKMLSVPPVTLPLGISGKFTVKLIRRDGTVTHEHTQKNLILNQGLDYAMTASASSGPAVGQMMQHVAVGTGSSAPNVTDTALAAEVARTLSPLAFGAGDIYPSQASVGLGKFMRRFAFDFGEANGNLTELGIANASTGSLNTRALFVDEYDSPITITKTSSEQLVIEYELQLSVSPTVDTAGGTFAITGIGTITYSEAFSQRFIEYADGRKEYWGCGWGTNGAIAYYPGSTLNMNWTVFPRAVLLTNLAQSAYTNGDFYRDYTGIITAGPSDVTLAGFGWAHTYGLDIEAAYKIMFSAPITKGKDYQLTLTLRFTIARA